MNYTKNFFALFLLLFTSTISAQDNFEPNGTVAQAATINCGTLIEAFIQEAGDIDWYAVNVPETGSLKVELFNVPGNMDLTMDIYKLQDGIEVFIADDGISNASDGQSLTGAAFLTAGNYLIRVVDEGGNDSNTTEAYRLRATCLPNEYEINHTVETAAPISLNACIETNFYGENACFNSSTFGDNDLDWFSLEIPGTGTLATSLTNVPGNLDLDMAIYQVIDGQLRIIADDSDNSASGGQSVFSQAFVEAGTYYIFIQDEGNNAWNEENYTLCNTFVASPYEINQTIDMAAPIPLNGCIQETLYGENTLFDDSNFGDNDRDFFQIEVPATGTIRVDLTEVPSNLDLDLRILNFDENNQVQLISQDDDSNANGGQSMRSFAFVEAGTYYIRVVDEGNNNLSDEPYTLCVAFTENPLEMNQTPALASPIPNDTCFMENIFGENNIFFDSNEGDNDQDWFKIQVPEAGEIFAGVSNVPSNLDLDVIIVQLDGSILTTISRDNDTNASGGQSISTNAFVEAGEYIIGVRDESFNGQNEEPYTFCVNFTPNPFEINQTFDLAFPIPADTCLMDRIYGENAEFNTSTLGDNDIDWFVFSTPDSCDVMAEITNVASNLDLDIRIFQLVDGLPEAVLSDNDSNSGGGQSLFIDGTLPGGEYYLRVIDENNNGRSSEYYTLCLNCMLLTSTQENEPLQARIYPNPSPGIVHVQLAAPGSVEYAVYNSIGKQVAKGQLQRDQIDLGHLPAGVYSILLQGRTQRKFSRIILE